MQVIIRDEQGLAIKTYPEGYIPTFQELLIAVEENFQVEIKSKGESKCQS